MSLTMTHLLLMDLLSDKIITLAHTYKNVRTMTKEQADDLIELLGTSRDELVSRLKQHGSTGGD